MRKSWVVSVLFFLLNASAYSNEFMWDEGGVRDSLPGQQVVGVASEAADDCADAGIILDPYSEEVVIDCQFISLTDYPLNGYSSCVLGSTISYTIDDIYLPGDGCLNDVHRVYYISDQCGNTCTVTRIIHLQDTIGPSIVWNSYEAGVFSAEQLTANYSPVIEDACGLYTYSFTVTSQPHDTPVCDSYYEKLVFTATDQCGNVTVDSVEFGVYPGFISVIPEYEYGFYPDPSDGFTISNVYGDPIETVYFMDMLLTYYGWLHCLDLSPGCYQIDFFVSDPSQIQSINILGTEVTNSLTGLSPGHYEFSIGGAHCGPGCLDPLACNFDPESAGGGVCYQNCISTEFGGGIIPPDSQFGFAISSLNGFFVSGLLPYSGNLDLEPFSTYSLMMYSTELDGWGNNTLAFQAPEWNWYFETGYLPNSPNLIQFTTGGPGCMDQSACNWNPFATVDDGSCLYGYGCTDPSACNFNSLANCDDGSCQFLNSDFVMTLSPGPNGSLDLAAFGLEPVVGLDVQGCSTYYLMYPDGTQIELNPDNYGDAEAGISYILNHLPGNYSLTFVNCCVQADGTVISGNTTQNFEILPCDQADPNSTYMAISIVSNMGGVFSYCLTDLSGELTPLCESADFPNGGNASDLLCLGTGCYQIDISTNGQVVFDLVIGGQTFSNSESSGDYTYTYTFSVGAALGCSDETACNYNPESTCSDPSACVYATGCTDQMACNYDPMAACDNGSCFYPNPYFSIEYSFLNCGEIILELTAGNNAGAGEWSDGCWQYVITAPDGSVYYVPVSQPDMEGISVTSYSVSNVQIGLYSVFLTACCMNEYGTLLQAYYFNNFVIEEGYSGCMDASACNYQPTAICDDGSCSYCPPDNWCFHLVMSQEGGEMAGGRFKLISYDFEETVWLDVLLEPGQSVVDEYFCVPLEPGCYGVTFENYSETGSFSYFLHNTAWLITIGTFTLVDYPIELGYTLGSYSEIPGLLFEDLMGCMDPQSYTYDPSAVCHDPAFCQYCDADDLLHLSVQDINQGEYDGSEFWIMDPLGNNIAGYTNVNGLYVDTVVFCDNDLCGYWTVDVFAGARTGDLSLLITNALGDTLLYIPSGSLPEAGGIVANFSPGTAECGCLDNYACNYNPDVLYSWPESCLYIEGCTDPAATNYSEAAQCDDGSCYYCNNPHVLSLMDAAGDGWEGGILYLYNPAGDLLFSGSLDAGSSADVPLCLDFDCSQYVLHLVPDVDPSEVSWSLSFGEYSVSGGPGLYSFYAIPVTTGCSDPLASNYNPDANCPDDSCQFTCCAGDFNGDGVIGLVDLLGFLSVYGSSCP